MTDTDRLTVVRNLLTLDQPLSEIKTSLSKFPWDYDGQPAVLSVPLVNAILARFLDGSLSSEELGEWAELIECRDDVGFDPAHGELVKEIVFRLANPLLEGPITPVVVQSLLNTTSGLG